MNKLTEIKNHKVVYDGKDGKLIIPFSFSAIKEILPWVEGKDSQNKYIKNKIVGDANFPYIFISQDNEEYLLADLKSKIPTLYSGSYAVFGENYGIHPGISAHKVFSHKKEIANLLKLTYTPKQRIKLDMPYTDEELLEFSNKSQFAKAVYNVIKSDNSNLRKNIDKLFNFFGDKVNELGDGYLSHNADDEESIEFTDKGIFLYTSNRLYKDKYVVVDDDSDWVFDTVIGDYEDCEEMDADELQYIDNYLNERTNKKFIEFINKYEPGYWKLEGVTPENLAGLTQQNDEGSYDKFLSEYFSKDWDQLAWEVLEPMGCSVFRSRKEASKEEVFNEIIYKFDTQGRVGSTIFVTEITYTQLLQLIGSLGLESFTEIRNWDINELPYNLTDTWYDAWDIDEVGLMEINEAMVDVLEQLDRKYGENYKQIKKNTDDFKKILKDLGFGERKTRWGSYGDVWEKDIEEGKQIRVGKFTPIDNTVLVNVKNKEQQDGQYSKDFLVDVENLADEITNYKISFPEEEIKN